MGLGEKLKQKVGEKVTEASMSAVDLCDQADAMVEEANLNKDAGGAVQAVNLYYEAIRQNVREIRAYIGIAYVLYHSDDIYGAIGALNQAVKIEPDHKKVNQWLEIFNKEYAQKSKSIQLSMMAGKALNGKFETEETSSVSIFDRVTSFFARKAAKNTTITLSDGKTAVAAGPQAPRAPGNIFEAIREAKSTK
jgi:hypothetical protein